MRKSLKSISFSEINYHNSNIARFYEHAVREVEIPQSDAMMLSDTFNCLTFNGISLLNAG
jgi:hypothetical protein